MTSYSQDASKRYQSGRRYYYDQQQEKIFMQNDLSPAQGSCVRFLIGSLCQFNGGNSE